MAGEMRKTGTKIGDRHLFPLLKNRGNRCLSPILPILVLCLLFFVFCFLSSVHSQEGPIIEEVTPQAEQADTSLQEANADEQAGEEAPEREEDFEKISLDLKGAEISEVLRVLSKKTGLTIVPSNAVTGRVNIFLNNVSFEDTLDIILFTQNLALERKKDILYVMTSAEYKFLYGREYFEKREYRSVQLRYADPTGVFNVVSQVKSDIGKVIADEATGSIILIDTPEKLEYMESLIDQLDTALESRVYDLNYAKTDDIKIHLAEIMTPGTGKIIVDKRSAKLIVSDLPEKMERIEEVIKNLDEQDREVFIEAEIVQVTLTDKLDRGINWENVFSPRRDGIDLINKFPVSPALSSPLGKLTVGAIANDGYTATIEFLQTIGDVKILSRPRIAVLNNEEAKILVGTREAFISSSSSQGQSTTITTESIEYIDVGIKLNVTPTINKQGFITMKIKPEVSEVASTLTTAAGSRVPIVSTSEAETVVRVKDGTMIMIAGLMKTERRGDMSGVPFLSKIPFIGAAFSTKTQDDKNTELIIFLTPHIISGEATLAGNEVENFIPKEILPEDIKKDIIRKELEKIRNGVVAQELRKDPVISKMTLNRKLKGLKAY